MGTAQTAFRTLLCAITGLLLFFSAEASAQDLYVKWVTATPSSGAAGDAVTVQARIGNNGPGMAIGVELQWLPSRLCRGDFNHDGDVDGADLAAYIANPGTLASADFAAEFGSRVDCP